MITIITVDNYGTAKLEVVSRAVVEARLNSDYYKNFKPKTLDNDYVTIGDLRGVVFFIPASPVAPFHRMVLPE